MKTITVRQLGAAAIVRLDCHGDRPAYDQLLANGWHVLNIHIRGDLTTLSATSAPEIHHDAPPASGPWITPICFIRLAAADFNRLLEAPERMTECRS